ncbi:MAG: glutamate 5-kinase [Dehalococcoidia bacterium]|nr:glutamate 5-kinase [Dehalococcoidia bacterium]
MARASQDNQPSIKSGSADSGLSSSNLRYRRIVVKAGTSALTSEAGLDSEMMSDLVRQLCQVRDAYGEVLLVTSGAIAAGRSALGASIGEVGTDISSRQVFAAVGQTRLMHTYQEMFATHGAQTAQTLLTIPDLSNRQSYLNVGNTLQRLLELRVVPVVNENDVVAVDEIGEVFGDNDRLSALVANLVDADLLLILTDTEGLYSADPRTNPDATLITEVEQVDASIESLAGEDLHPWARGGMATKLEAAKLVTTSGIPMVMCHARADNVVLRAARGESVGTFFKPANGKMEARKRWMLSGISQRGQIVVDSGAAGALVKDHRSLLPAGIQDVEGDFGRGESIYVVDANGVKIACGIANYAARDIGKIQGMNSELIEETLGYHYGQEVVHRNNLVLL